MGLLVDFEYSIFCLSVLAIFMIRYRTDEGISCGNDNVCM